MTKLPKGTVAIMAVVTKACLCVRMLCCDCFPGVVVCRRDVETRTFGWCQNEEDQNNATENSPST